MSTESAFLGQPANTVKDGYVMKFAFKGKPPPFKAPDGYVYETRGPGLIAGLSVAIFLILLITGTRVGLRGYQKHMKLGLDDVVIIPAALVIIAYLLTIISRVPDGGAGRHTWDVRYEELTKFYVVSSTPILLIVFRFSHLDKVGNVGQVLFYAGTALTKISITLFNRRLTGISSKRWKILHYTFLVLLIIWLVVGFFVNVLQCKPAIYRYDYFARGRDGPTAYKCIDPALLANSFSIIHAVTDFMLLTVPIIVIWRVKLPWATKIRIMLLFAFGLISCVCAAFRVVIQNWSSTDFTWTFAATISVTVIDCTTGVIVASLPALNTLIDSAWPARWKTKSRPTYYVSGQNGNSNLSGSTKGPQSSTRSVTQSASPGIWRKDEVELDYFPEKSISKEKLQPGKPQGDDNV
ncbi:MAG: hypothetical protein M1825_003040 [Sarcosagium campestre]|nr:MAG: hypothetical protein M1825_003040 [Sarcosagium campestre]